MLTVIEIPYRDPLAVCRLWADDPYLAFLDSAAAGDPRANYSYIGVEPFQIVDLVDGQTRVDGVAVSGDPFAILATLLDRYRLDDPAPVPFAGGAMGFLGYELGRYLEKLPQRHDVDDAVPEMAIGFYDLVIAFDVVARRAWIISSGFPESGNSARQERARIRANACLARLERIEAVTAWPVPRACWEAALSLDGYRRGVARILEHVAAGDIFQANFTMRFEAARPEGFHPFDAYLALRHLSAGPFAGYLRCGPALTLASASPERFLSLDRAGRTEARPIKGTAPRGRTEAADRAARDWLAASIKDRAENLMIVDLIRNDLGRVAEIGSVVVPSLMQVERFASVHHLVSAVEARLRPGLGPIDLLRATFPGGSVTGAPKIRAMEIIDDCEVSARGAYCGAILWIGFDGAMDSSIVIRTLAITRERVIAQAGGGIVADSDPDAEYRELRLKLQPLLDVMGGAVSGEG